ncbi:LysR substrate-binding domain-containing protein [Pseudonocardia thermophila]|uniref:LysR substrate-binding domain-containing protein n=1 Tax=Pseudonocardia thermophila TaxID=1848 RepID=UPI00248E22B2|nr:LysR substrate-binding domain-containing protein [Pseudonocardia thermophila]
MPDEQTELQLFLHLCSTLNFGRTSLDCHVSPSTLTRTVQRLEARAGQRLLDRGPRGVALTPAGQRFRAYAEEVTQAWAAFRAGNPAPGDLSGTLRIFATVTACQALLPDLLAPLRAAHPLVTVDLRTGDAAAALARLDEGSVDAVVAGVPDRVPQSMLVRTVTSTDLVFVSAPGRHDPLGGPFVLPRRGLVRENAERWFRSRSNRMPAVAAEPDGHEAVLTLAALGYGTGIVPRLVLDSSVVAQRLAEVPAEPGPEPMRIGLCVRRADLRRPIVAALWSTT